MLYIKASQLDDNTFMTKMSEYLADPKAKFPEYCKLFLKDYERRVKEKTMLDPTHQNEIFTDCLNVKQNNTTMKVKRIIPDKESNFIHASESTKCKCIFYNETSGAVGIFITINSGGYVTWADGGQSPTFKTFNEAVLYMGKCADRIIITQIEGY